MEPSDIHASALCRSDRLGGPYAHTSLFREGGVILRPSARCIAFKYNPMFRMRLAHRSRLRIAGDSEADVVEDGRPLRDAVVEQLG